MSAAQILTQDRRVRIFLSSRIPEFSAERKALVRLIKQMGLTPIFFEEVPRPHPPRDLYTAYLEQSDLFIGLYGSGYGWVDEEAGMAISGVHDEWDLSNGMPRLIFVKDGPEPREPRLEELLGEIRASGLTFNHFTSVNELVTRARAAIALCVTERFLAQEMQSTPVLPNYIEQVAADLEKHPIVTTRFFAEELQPALIAHSRVFIQGSPGSGKTVALFQLSRNHSSTIYLSLRNQSLLSAASHVVIKLARTAGIPVPSLTSAAEALEICESLLKKVPSLLLIDDVDQMPDVAARLSTIAPGTGRLVFGGRFVPQAFLQGFHLLQCAGFAEAEAQEYLETALGSLSIQSQTALGRSHGNPLYLRYYLETPSADPPASLTAFHVGMWGSLSVSEKELIGALALSEVALTLEQIAEVLGAYRETSVTGIAAQTEVQGLGHLVSSHAGQVRLFHPAFRDFVCTELLNAGLAESIHRHLANAFRKPSELFLRVVHSVRGGMADKVYKHLLRTASWATITGRIGVSRELLAATLRLARRKHQWLTAGFALHQSADLKQTTRSIPSALLSAQLAEKVLLRSRSKDAALAARITKAVFLIEVGRGDEAEAILKSAVAECESQGLAHTVAAIRINLSYLHLRQGRLRECAEECEKAEAVFEDTGDLWGVATAVLNAQNYYVADYDRPKLIASIKRLLSLAKQLDSPRVEMGAYNGMTVLYRRQKKFELAERVCLKAIALARNLGIWTVEAINTGNLGNIYRDQKRYDKARECYETSLRIAEERSSKHHIAWAKEQLATILANEGDLQASLIMADEALGLWREIGDAYREANTEDDQGATYSKLLRHFEAGKSYERAAEAWIRADMCDAAVRGFYRAYEQYIAGGHFEEAARGFEAAWTTVVARGTAKDALKLLRVISPPVAPVIPLLDLTRIVETAAPLFSTVENRLLVMDAVATLAAVCKQMRADIGESLYAKHLRLLAEQSLESGSSNAVIALAFSIEQAPDAVIDSPAFKEVCSALAKRAPNLRYRNDNLVGERWTVILPAPKAPAFELLVAEKMPGVRAASAIVVLLLWTKRDMIVSQIGKRKWSRIGVMFTALAVEEAKAQGIELPAYVSPQFPGLLTQLSDPKDERQTPLPFFISGAFLTYADRIKESRNRCSLWLTMLLYDGVVQNFTHFTIPRRKATKLRGEFMSDVFGLQRDSQDDDESESETGDDSFEGL